MDVSNAKLQRQLAQQKSRERASAVISEVLTAHVHKYHLIEHFVVAWGYNAAALLGYLLNKYYYYLSQGQLATHKKHGAQWFYFTIEHCKKTLHLSRDEQDFAIRTLKKAGILDVQTFGSPRPQRHFFLYLEKISEAILDPNLRERLRETHNHECGKPTTMNAGNPQSSPTPPYIGKIYINNNNTPYSPSKVEQNAANAACVSVPPKSLNLPEEKLEVEEVIVTQEAEFHYAPDPVHDVIVKEKIEIKEKVVKDQTDKSRQEYLRYGADGYVRLTAKQYADLLTHMSEKERDEWIESLNNEIGAQGEDKFNKKYRSHYHVILKWRKYRADKQPKNHDGKDLNKIAPHRRGSKYVTSGDFDDYEFPEHRKL